jgi:cyclophilin family peptidyl-prolyl cis-trans isomerase
MNLTISNLSKTYSNGVRALHNVSLDIPSGMFGLLGPNGAGKSTLMRTIATLQQPDTGSIRLGDIDVLKQPGDVRKILGYLPQDGYFDDARFYRVVYGFVAQFGIAGDPAIARLWSQRPLRPDSARAPNARGTISYAQYKPTDRTTNLFINLHDNPNLDSLGFTPIGRVVQGMEVADSLYSRYGEMTMAEPPFGDGKRLYRESNKYMGRRVPDARSDPEGHDPKWR